jgi:hypothetical protein
MESSHAGTCLALNGSHPSGLALVLSCIVARNGRRRHCQRSDGFAAAGESAVVPSVGAWINSCAMGGYGNTKNTAILQWGG